MLCLFNSFLNVANESMCRPIRTLTEGKGYDVRRHRLAAFGGAGGQHACSLARILGMDEVVIHKYSSILSAYGLALADVIHECLEPSSATLDADSLPNLKQRMDSLQDKAREQLQEQGFADKSLRYERFLNLRYSGTSTALMIQEPEDGDFEKAFRDRYIHEFSFHVPGRVVLVDDIRVRGIATDNISSHHESISEQLAKADRNSVRVDKSLACDTSTVYFTTSGPLSTPVYKLEKLPQYSQVHVSPMMMIRRRRSSPTSKVSFGLQASLSFLGPGSDPGSDADYSGSSRRERYRSAIQDCHPGRQLH